MTHIKDRNKKLLMKEIERKTAAMAGAEEGAKYEFYLRKLKEHYRQFLSLPLEK